MLTKEQVFEQVKGGRESDCGMIDSRDYARLIDFFEVEKWEAFGFTPEEGADIPPPKEWTRENILAQLERDVDFGFEKALTRRGISAGLMFEVVRMWMWVLEDELANYGDAEYAQYGLPLFKAVAVKYGFANPIGDDAGTEEHKYSEDADWGDE